MLIKIEVGHGLDGGLTKSPQSSQGVMTLGPERLLSWLETRLGVELPETSFTARMLQYLQCLKECDTAERFYHQSLKQDELGVAQELLQRRDQWYEAGWDGEPLKGDASNRLRDIVEVEIVAADRVAPGTGQRVQRVTAALSGQSSDISVVLLDAPETFAKVWQQVFSVLNADVRSHTLTVNGAPGSDLAGLQTALLNADSGEEKVALSGDGSFLVLRDGSAHLSSHWVARYAQQFVDMAGNGTAAILSESSGGVFDAAREEGDMARLGFGESSLWRPVFQVLPLALELLWEPLDPAILLQFLSHPMGPLPGRMRARLATAVAEEPGIGSDKWQEAVNDSLDKVVSDLEPDLAKQRREELEVLLNIWLMNKRHNPEPGAPIEQVDERTRYVIDWLATSASFIESEPESGLFRIALNQARELSAALQRMKEASQMDVSRDSLRSLIEAVRGSGGRRPDLFRECRPDEAQLLRADSPAGVIESVPLVIWFGCDEARLPRPHPWSQLELQQLQSSGVELLSLDAQLEWQAQTWLRPVCAASGQLVLVLHDDVEGHHPVFDQILAVAEGWQELRVEKVIGAGEDTLSGHPIPTVEHLEMRTLPSKVRWWQLNDAQYLTRRDKESYSSLAKFMYGPYQWVLDYKGKIRAGALAEIDDGNRLKGTLVHHLFELFFGSCGDITKLQSDQTGDWARGRLSLLIETSGAVLLAPGRQSEKEDFIETTVRSLIELVRCLQSARVIQVAMEEQYEGRFIGGGLAGIIDLYATNADGQTAVVDIKWGGYKYRQKSFQESDYLQLAVYASLCKQQTQRWPVLAYYIISDARMVVLDSDYFPGAEQVFPANGENVAQFWQRAESTWQWRRAQLDRGLIEVPVKDTEPTEESFLDDDGLPMPETYDSFHDYGVLTGWEPLS